jgi:cobalt transporter subunit CbtA
MPMATAHSQEAMGHGHSPGAWEPADGLERTAFTIVINILTAIGYALILTGLFVLRGRPVGWREGLLWGLSGFLVVTVAPGLGLSPELPGVQAAPVLERQLWWIGTAAATAIGLALLVFRRSPWAAAVAIILFVVPHVIGAPRLAEQHSNVPEALYHQFVVAVTLTSLLSWALLGWLSAVFYRRFDARALDGRVG